MTNTYDSRDGDRLYIPSVGEIQCFNVTPKRPPSGLFTLLIIAHSESKDAQVEFFNAQQKKAAKDQCCVTATHDLDETILELTVIDYKVNVCPEGREFEIIATMKDLDDRKYSSAIQSKRV
ncbi:hypothetical protein OB959_23015 [Aeromonas bestiarum]|uniref:Uncharacterized protein n=1 Tax=Aeromonas bestiarum TaxID=105751 RepID=A0AAW7IJJ7_9GAMM|nr:hypothetical protein [Aeromonas bestiarum]MDM5142623.1 hypothetical protein [Aeromonas bestiarum]